MQPDQPSLFAIIMSRTVPYGEEYELKELSRKGAVKAMAAQVGLSTSVAKPAIKIVPRPMLVD